MSESPDGPRVKKRRWWVVAAALLALLASAENWRMRGYPRQFWKERPPEQRPVPPDRCPDGMCRQIGLFADWYRGAEDAAPRLLRFLRTSHQSSTFLVGASAAPLVLMGIPAPLAFTLLSALGSAALIAVFLRLSSLVAPDHPRLRGLALAILLTHPAALRCMAWPQTDALLGLFVLLALCLGQCLAGQPRRWFWVALPVLQILGLFVKIHSLCILPIPAATAFLLGVRGRRLALGAVLGSAVPALVWLAVFEGLSLWSSIESAWRFKETFYGNWHFRGVVQVLLPTALPLLVVAAGHPGLRRGLPAALGLTVVGYAAILAICGIPPLMRFQYPALAPLVLLASGAVARDSRRPLRVLLPVAGLCSCAIAGGVLLCAVYNRYLGPLRDLGDLAGYLYLFV